ncbi:MAG: dual specificity protein phosphatase family protein [Muribaculaceae bacterium]|nr:dual specificity protein phosphatase family protein [Muribaculaceae bacterium]
MKVYQFAPIKTRSFPTIQELNNPYIFKGTKCVINVSERENAELIKLYQDNSIAYHHFPLKENVEDMGWENILKAVKVLLDNIKNQIPTIVHCIGGNNRSPLVVEAAHYVLTGLHIEMNTMDSIIISSIT